MYVGFKRVTMLADYCLLRGTFKLKNRQDGFLRWIFFISSYNDKLRLPMVKRIYLVASAYDREMHNFFLLPIISLEIRFTERCLATLVTFNFL